MNSEWPATKSWRGIWDVGFSISGLGESSREYHGIQWLWCLWYDIGFIGILIIYIFWYWLLQPDHHHELNPSDFYRSDISITRRSAGSSLWMPQLNLRTKDLTVNWWIDEFHWIWISLAFKLGEVPASCEHQCEHQSATIHWNLRRAAHGKASSVQLKVGMDPLNKGNLTNQRVRFFTIFTNWENFFHFDFFLIWQ